MQASLERLRARREQRGGEGGFTLIELLIVIVILGILAAIVVFAVQNLTGQASTAGCQSDYKTVETAAEAYKAQMETYPASISTMTSTATQPGTTNTVGPWLKDVPNSAHYTMTINSSAMATGAYVTNNQGTSTTQIAATAPTDGVIYIQPTGANSATNPAGYGTSAANACYAVK